MQHSQKPTPEYYYSEAHTIFFGDGRENVTFVKSMQCNLLEDVETEVNRLNRERGYVAPIDDNFVDFQ